MKKRILVTGGTGFIGSHTAVELIDAGYDVLILDNLENSDPRVLDGISDITGTKPDFFKVDLRDKNALKSFFEANRPIDAVIHFAAYKAVGESVAEPLKYYENNIGSLINLLEQMQAYAIKNMVFSSSCTLYGEPDSLPVDESSPIKRPASPYGNTKRICEEILEEAAHALGAQCITLRYFNPVGAHYSARIGELPIGTPNNLIPFITQTAAGIHKEIVVHGGDYPTPDGTCIRDYIHVVDLAKAHVIALERLLAGKNIGSPEVFNLGTGRGNSVLEVIRAFENTTGQKLNYRIGPRRPGDVMQIYSDTKKANEVLGWRAKEDLDSMMSTAWSWQVNIPKYFPAK